MINRYLGDMNYYTLLIAFVIIIICMYVDFLKLENKYLQARSLIVIKCNVRSGVCYERL